MPLGDEGEIAIKCDGQMLGFWENPEATEQRMTKDGFVLTGDVGRLDDNAYLYVLDRKDDMIISGGFNIWPAELENAILDHPAVVEAAVFAHPGRALGRDAPGRMRRGARRRGLRAGDHRPLPRPARVLQEARQGGVPGGALPKSPVGKLQRKVLREPYWQGQGRRVGSN